MDGANSDPCPKDLRQKFKDITKQFSPEQRPFYAHMTTAIVSRYACSITSGTEYLQICGRIHMQDTKATAITLGAVREGILRDHLRGADFI